MNIKIAGVLLFVGLTFGAGSQGNAQQAVYHRSDAGTDNWWDGANPWHYATWANNQDRPDRWEFDVRNFVHIGHNNNLAMNVNGDFFGIGSLTLDAGASSARTFTGSGGGGIGLTIGLYNDSTAHHIFNTEIGVDAANVTFSATSGQLTLGSTIYLNANTASFEGANNITVNGVMQGTGGITKSGNGTLFLGGNNTYSGSTVVNGGTIQLSLANRISDSSALFVNNGGTFNLNGNDETVASMSLASGGAVQLGVGQLIVNDASGTWAGTIAGSAGGSVVKKGSGTVSITADNSSMAGDWYVVGGTAGFNNNNAAGSGTIYLGEESGTDAATIDISQTGVNVGNDIVVRTGSSGFKTINVGGAANASVEFSGDVTLNALVRLEAGSGETLTLSGTVGGVGQVSKIGAGTVILSGQNTYAGNTAVDAGTLVVSGDINNNGLFLGLAAGADDATLQLSGAGSGFGAVTVNSGAGARNLNVTAGAHTIAGNTEVNRDFSVTVSGGSLNMANVDLDQADDYDLNMNMSGGSATISGAITADSGGSQLNKSGNGSLTLSGDNSGSSFMLNVNGGTVVLANNNALGVGYGDKVNFYQDGTLQVNADVGPASLGVRGDAGRTITLNVNGGNTFTVSTLARITGSTTFNKTGTGTMELTGDSENFTSGSTLNVNQGTVTLSGTMTDGAGITLAAGANLNVSGSAGVITQNGGTLTLSGSSGNIDLFGGTLQGSGTMASLNQTGGVLNPGSSPGVLNITGNASWTGGSYLWETTVINPGGGGVAGTDWDLVNITGTLTIGAGYTVNIDDLNVLPGWDSADSYSWLIAQADEGIVGFDNLGLNTAAWNENAYSGTFSLSEVGNQIYLNYTGNEDPPPEPGSAVPEPNTLSFAMLAGLIIFSMRSYLKRSAKLATA